MSTMDQLGGINVPSPLTFTSPSAAKARLLAWAEEHDARQLKARSGIGAIATSGVLAVLGGMAIARIFTPRRPSNTSGSRVTSVGKRLISWALIARAGKWLLPHAISAVQSSMKRGATS